MSKRPATESEPVGYDYVLVPIVTSTKHERGYSVTIVDSAEPSQQVCFLWCPPDTLTPGELSIIESYPGFSCGGEPNDHPLYEHACRFFGFMDEEEEFDSGDVRQLALLGNHGNAYQDTPIKPPTAPILNHENRLFVMNFAM